jgi:hypothetical protein
MKTGFHAPDTAHPSQILDIGSAQSTVKKVGWAHPERRRRGSPRAPSRGSSRAPSKRNCGLQSKDVDHAQHRTVPRRRPRSLDAMCKMFCGVMLRSAALGEGGAARLLHRQACERSDPKIVLDKKQIIGRNGSPGLR